MTAHARTPRAEAETAGCADTKSTCKGVNVWPGTDQRLLTVLVTPQTQPSNVT